MSEKKLDKYLPEEIIFRSFKKCCISNERDGTQDNSIFEEDGDDDEQDTYDIHPELPMRESNFKELIEISDNDLDSKR